MRRIRLLFLIKTRQSLRVRTMRALMVGTFCLAFIGGIVAFIFHFSESPNTIASGNQVTFRSYQGLNFQKILRTQDGNILVSDGKNFIKSDSVGNIIWATGVTQTTNLIIAGLCETTNGDIVASCQSTDTTGGNAQIALIRLNVDGSLKWLKMLHKQGSDFIYGISADNENGVVMTGGGCSTNHLILKADAEGNLLWMKDFSIAGATGSANKIIVNSDGSLLVAGRLTESGSNYISLFKTDAGGSIFWGKKFLDQQQAVIKTFIKTSDNCLIIGGTYIGGNNPFLLKTDLSGNLLWFKRYGTNGIESINDMAATSDGGAIVTGNIYLNQDENVNALLFKVDASGALVWQKSAGNSEFNGAGYDDAYDICHITEHTYAVTGMAYWAYICTIDENGNGFCHESPVSLTVTSVTAQTISASYTPIASNMFDVTDAVASTSNIFIGAPHTCSSVNPTGLEQQPVPADESSQISLFPNPSDGNFNINYFFPYEGSGWLELYDLGGKKLSAIELPSYNRSVSLHYADLPSGIYLYQVIAGGKVFKREKFVISK